MSTPKSQNSARSQTNSFEPAFGLIEELREAHGREYADFRRDSDKIRDQVEGLKSLNYLLSAMDLRDIEEFNERYIVPHPVADLAEIEDTSGAITNAVEELVEQIRRLQFRALAMHLNAWAQTRGPDLDFNAKQELAAFVRDKSRRIDASLDAQMGLRAASRDGFNPGEPCLLYAVKGGGIKGHYTLQSKNTGKRLGVFHSIKELVPFMLTYDAIRRESKGGTRGPKISKD